MALAVEEVNYSQITPAEGYFFDLTDQKALRDNGVLLGAVLLPDAKLGPRAQPSWNLRIKSWIDRTGGRNLGVFLTNRKGGRGPLGQGQLAISFDEDICAIGFHAAMDTGKGPRGHFQILFFDREGTQIGYQERWPGYGVTRQAFGTSRPDEAIAAIEIRSDHDGGFGIGQLRIVPCALAMM